MGAYVEKICSNPNCQTISKKRKTRDACPKCGAKMEVITRRGNPKKSAAGKIVKRLKFSKKKKKAKWLEGEIW